jgi:hypothetical protein
MEKHRSADNSSTTEAREKLRAVFETLNFLAILCRFDQIQKQSK